MKKKIKSLRKAGTNSDYMFAGSGTERKIFWKETTGWMLRLRKKGKATPAQLEWLEENKGRKSNQWEMKHRNGAWKES